MTVEAYMARLAGMVERELDGVLPAGWDVPARLREAMMYSLKAGGKRVRPVLVLAAAEAVRGDGSASEAAMPAACAVELVHTYSLIHDDLPAMDNDDFRRGKPTNHRVFGEAMAILAGDGLLTHSFYILASSAKTVDLPAEDILEMISELSRLAGPSGMVGGQALDMEATESELTLEALEKMHRHKTGDLIVFALKAGGMIGKANEQQMKALEQFGYRIGLAFQIQDDVLDVIGDEKKLGKSTHRDSMLEKATYPQLLGLDQCRLKIKQLTEEGKQWIIDARFPNPDKLLLLADYLMNRDH